jgi:hypothetical protein
VIGQQVALRDSDLPATEMVEGREINILPGMELSSVFGGDSDRRGSLG